MTSNEAELIERLIVEAAKRGTVEELMRQSVKTAEEAANELKAERDKTKNFPSIMAGLTADSRRIHISRERIFQALRCLVLALNYRGKKKRIQVSEALKDAGRALEGYVPF